MNNIRHRRKSTKRPFTFSLFARQTDLCHSTAMHDGTTIVNWIPHSLNSQRACFCVCVQRDKNGIKRKANALCHRITIETTRKKRKKKNTGTKQKYKYDKNNKRKVKTVKPDRSDSIHASSSKPLVIYNI